MYDNKVRLSSDVLEKAERIAAAWGLKNARAAVEAVFRCYCDDYLYGRPGEGGAAAPAVLQPGLSPVAQGVSAVARTAIAPGSTKTEPCEALAALDQLLAL
ncbi:MAG TPA: hypothetical protein IGR64_16960 [Leptolyngbyaceae cyanobacterium M65_K2018_010]|nr:hypothetical protein [Leptolyngbyaceae cyanobacterium M65_K2018_010]